MVEGKHVARHLNRSVLEVSRPMVKVLKVYRKLGEHAAVAHFHSCSRDVPLEQAGTAASSALHLSETNVTPAMVFDNTAKAQLTGRRHNGTNRRASQTHKRVIISNDRNSKWKTTAEKINRSHLQTPQHPHGVVCS